MLTRNVYYSERPKQFLITSMGTKAVVEFPLDVTEIEAEETVQYLADKVYSLTTKNTADLEARIQANYDEWLEKAKEPEPQNVTLADVVEAVNVLTDLILGGEL